MDGFTLVRLKMERMREFHFNVEHSFYVAGELFDFYVNKKYIESERNVKIEQCYVDEKIYKFIKWPNVL